jgi:hypothetical protein
VTTCTCSPVGGTPQCDRSVRCPAHGGGVCAERKADGLVTHLGPGFLGSVSHKGRREDCTYPDCEWPRQDDWVSAISRGVERTGELVDFHIIRTSAGNEYGILKSTIRRPDWGMYCRHGLKIVEAVPAEHTLQEPRPLCTLGQDDPFHECAEPRYCPACHPVGRKVSPWPCQEDGCTEADFDRAQEQEIEEYYESLAEHARADW